MLSCPRIFIALATLALSGCGSTVVVADGSDVPTDAAQDAATDSPPHDAGRVPMNHRTDSAQCAGAPGPGNCSFGGSGPPSSCRGDSECTAGSNGRCVLEGGGVAICQCSYDTCTSDSQCTTGGPCACHGSNYLTGGNTCVPGNCRVDSDCGAGGYCSPSRGESNCGGLDGYFCHTPSDTCVDDSDCPSGTGGPQMCVHRSSTSRWECVPQLFCA